VIRLETALEIALTSQGIKTDPKRLDKNND
jgi:hypothetical protein